MHEYLTQLLIDVQDQREADLPLFAGNADLALMPFRRERDD
jgi:hypothetical protein